MNPEPPATLPARLIPLEKRDDPYPYYAALRDGGVLHDAGGGVWLLPRYGEVAAALREPALVRSPPAPAEAPPPTPDWLDWLVDRTASVSGRAATVGLSRLWMINLDPPEHPPLRRSAGRELGAASLAALRPRVEAIAAELLDELEVSLTSGRSFDLMRSFALPFPARVIAELLGVPASERERTIALARLLGPAVSGESLSPAARAEAIDRASAATVELARLFVELLRRPSGAPRGLLAHFAEAGLAEPVAVAQALLLFFAGEETTANWIGNGVVAWLGGAGGGRSWPVAPAEARAALEELLRFDSPVQFTLRRSSGVEIAGTRVPDGDYVALLIGSANRDPTRFERADELVPARDPNPHLAFGAGLHGCLGAGLARLEAEVAFRALFERLPALALAGRPERRPGALLRGYAAVPVSAGAPRGGGR